MPPRPGDLIGGKYRILRLIGDGGMGSVYEARHEGLGMAVALKFLHEDLAERPGIAERFLREARIAATVQSPHVTHVTDVDVGPGGLPYLVMELLQGESLQHLLDRERKLTPKVALDFALQIAAGLEAAHAVGVVHRDLKPDNVFVTPSAGGPLLKLLDFGIAKVYAGAGQRGLTQAGVVMGTAEYMPPEQLYAAGEVDGRADVYALGVMLFEMLSGRRPADGDDAQVIVGKVLAGDVLSLAALEPGLPPGLVEVVKHATAGDRDHRIPSARELRTALAGFATELSPPGALAARVAPLEPTADAAPERERDSYAKGATEQAPPLAPGAFAAQPPILRPPAGAPPRRKRGAKVWLWTSLALLLAAGASAGGYVLWTEQQGSSLPPPPIDTSVTPAPEAFGPQGQATSFVPTASPTAPSTAPVPTSGSTSSRGAHGGLPNPEPTGTATSDGGLFPVPPLQLPSTFPPLPLPSGFPTALPTSLPTSLPTNLPNVLPSVLPTGFPTSFPNFPGFPPAPAPTNPPPARDGGK